MVELRWLPRLGPPIVAAAAVGLLASSSIGATRPAWDPPACTGAAGPVTAAAAIPGPARPERLAGEAWFRLTPRLDQAGALAGQSLEIGRLGSPSAILDLPAESFAAGPFGRVVLVGADDGTTSELRAVDRASACAHVLGHELDVIRRATIDPAGRFVYEFRVARASRADLGIWRRPLGGGQTVRVMPPLAADPRFGRTFTTELGWSAEGDLLTVQSCGAARCRTRLLDPSTGRTWTVDGADHGELIGVTRERLVAYGPCLGAPCPIVAIDATTGDVTTLAPTAALARLVPSDGGAKVVAEVADHGTLGLAVLDPAGGGLVQLPVAADGLRLVPSAARAGAASRLPAGWVLLAPEGRAIDSAQSILVRLVDGSSLELGEVIR